MISIIVRGCTVLYNPPNADRWEKVGLALDIILALGFLALGVSRIGMDKGWWKASSALDFLNESQANKLAIVGGVNLLLIMAANQFRFQSQVQPDQFEAIVDLTARIRALGLEQLGVDMLAQNPQMLGAMAGLGVPPGAFAGVAAPQHRPGVAQILPLVSPQTGELMCTHCATCLEEFHLPAPRDPPPILLGHNVSATSSHLFHPGCLEPWLRTNNTCPTCRHHFPAPAPVE